MTAVDGDISIKIFAFAVNSVSSKKKAKQKKKTANKNIVFISSTFAWFVVV